MHTHHYSIVIRDCVRPVIDRLQEHKGIVLVVLKREETIMYSTQDVENLLLLARHQALLNTTTDLMGSTDDTVKVITLKSHR